MLALTRFGGYADVVVVNKLDSASPAADRSNGILVSRPKWSSTQIFPSKYIFPFLMFFGFTGEAFKVEQQLLLKLGGQTGVGHYVVRNDGIRVTDDGQKQMITAHVTVFRDGREIDKAYPAKWFYRKHEQEPVSQVAIRRSAAEDLYIVMPGFDPQEQSVSLQVVINPLVDWIWAGFGILAMGTLIALLPEATFSFAAVRVPAGAATTTLVLLLLHPQSREYERIWFK